MRVYKTRRNVKSEMRMANIELGAGVKEKLVSALIFESLRSILY